VRSTVDDVIERLVGQRPCLHLEAKLVDHVDDGFAETPLDLLGLGSIYSPSSSKLPAEPSPHRVRSDLEACGDFLEGKAELSGARQSPRPTLL
jgi:hypothetical protein